jgi:hypothetical protein
LSDKLSTQPAATQAPPMPTAPLAIDRAAGARILARSFYKELRDSGYTPKQLLSLSTELIDLITQDIARERSEVKGAA